MAEIVERVIRLVCWSALPDERVIEDTVDADGAQRSVDEIDPVVAVEERVADIAARLAAVRIVADERIVDNALYTTPAGAALDRVDSMLQRPRPTSIATTWPRRRCPGSPAAR